MEDNGWEQYQKHVLSELTDLKQMVNTVHTNHLHDIDMRLTKIETTLSNAKFVIPILAGVCVVIFEFIIEVGKKALG